MLYLEDKLILFLKDRESYTFIYIFCVLFAHNPIKYKQVLNKSIRQKKKKKKKKPTNYYSQSEWAWDLVWFSFFV